MVSFFPLVNTATQTYQSAGWKILQLKSDISQLIVPEFVKNVILEFHLES